MFRFFANLILIKILKWKVVGSFPKIPKFVIAVFPHTSNYDFFVGIFIRSVLREEINYVGKKELFNPLTSWFFKGLGGAPLSREGNQGVDLMRSNSLYCLAISLFSNLPYGSA